MDANQVGIAVQSGDWVTVVVAVLAALWTLFGGTQMLVRWRDAQMRAAESAGNEVERQRRLLQARVLEMARGATAEVYQEFVRTKKDQAEDGKLTEEEKNKAMRRALGKMALQGEQIGVNLATEFGTPFMKALVESSVSWLKQQANSANPPTAPGE